ncbi:MAG: hypothetical protein R3E09_08185 [Novosphingobium sp.]|nr:hypothetical protein [Novosphingobium sp.]
MRWYGVILCLAFLGCSQEPSFDERYEQADKAVRGKADAIDAELAGQETARSSDAAPADDAEVSSAP